MENIQINLNRPNNKMKYQENVYITGDLSPNGKIKRLLQVGVNLYASLSNDNKPYENRIANIKIIFLEEKEYVTFNQSAFSASVKIWLIYQESLQMFSYVIEIIPKTGINRNNLKVGDSQVKKIIHSLIQNIDYSLIIDALKKLGIKFNEKLLLNPEIFHWSFSIKSIPIKLSKNDNNGPAMPLNNKNYWKLKL
jgi:hypothetical protein